MNYVDLYQSGALLQRVRQAYRRIAACDLCPQNCRVNRLKGERGMCGAGLQPKIASSNVHNGEEPPISGTKGSGTIFFAGCSLRCRFCQNFPISQFGNGEEISTAAMAARMMKLQLQGVHNVNFVTPTHFLPQILAALWLAVPQGFRLPIVWNSSGYELVDTLGLLDGVVSIYLPDMKYADDVVATRLSGAPDYNAVNRSAVVEMLRQVGHLQVDEKGIAFKGLIIRHLVLPNRLSGTRESLQWISMNLGIETHVSLMSQYFPAHAALKEPDINRRISGEEYNEAVEWLSDAVLEHGWVQDHEED